jgi:hypothetical protein
MLSLSWIVRLGLLRTFWSNSCKARRCGGIVVVVQSWGDGVGGGRKATSAEETFDERLYVTRTATQLYIFVSRSSGKEPESFRSVQLISVCPIVPSHLCSI